MDIVFASGIFVQRTQIEAAFPERIGRRIEREPIRILGGQRGTEENESRQDNSLKTIGHGRESGERGERCNRFLREVAAVWCGVCFGRVRGQ
jgi:hypothetical protein